MSLPSDKLEQLEALVSTLCDGQLAPAEAARLEALACESDEARRYFLDYVQIHSELYWQFAASRDSSPEALAEPASPRRRLPQPLRWLARASAASRALVALAAGLLIVGLAFWLAGPGGPPPMPDRPAAATLAHTFDARFNGDLASLSDGALLATGTMLDLSDGLAEIEFQDGARVVLEGPARFELSGPDRGRLAIGSLHATVPEQAVGFTVETPAAVVVDRGTEFGVVVDPSGTSEVHVFAGSVEVLAKSDVPAVSSPQAVVAGNSVRVHTPAADASRPLEPIPAGQREFATEIPADRLPGSLAALRSLVAGHPGLLHHYTFEGDDPRHRCRDRRGNLDLLEAVMTAGRGDGKAAYRRGALEPSNTAVEPYRGRRSGNRTGVGFQSDDVFQPPDRMTVELLVNFSGFEQLHDGNIAAAVATRADGRDCGFLVVAVDTGQLAYLLDGQSPWGGTAASLVPGEWYYVACTMRVESGKTETNVYMANLTRGQTALQWVVRNELAKGTPAASRLGVGKGFDANAANAYPWPGLLDEVAIYNRVLDRQTIQQHLDALASPTEENKPEH